MIIEDDFINSLIVLLSYYDNIHDFGSLCTKRNTYICNELQNSYKKIITEEKDIIIEFINKHFSENTEFINILLKELENKTYSTFDKNKNTFINFVKYIIDKKLSQIKKINFNEMQNIIVSNFKQIFNNITDITDLLKILDYNFDETYTDNYDYIEINEFIKKNINDIELFFELKYVQDMIFLQRHHLYYLIYYHNIYDEKKRDEIIDYFIQNTNEKYKEIIINNLNTSDTIINITFPITMFDDMTTDTLNSNYIDKLFKFKMVNSDKEFIDSASTFNGKDFKNQKGSQQMMFIKNITTNKHHPVFFYNNSLELRIKDYIFTLVKKEETGYIRCKYNDIIFNIVQNSVGRSYKDEDTTNEGLFQMIPIIIKSLSSNLTEIDKEKLSTIIIIDADFNNSIDKLKTYKNADEIIVTLLFGAKRFGDWSQMNISKTNYFYLQTDDLLCKLYGILIGAPVLWIDNNYNIISYNYDKVKNNNINFDFDTIQNKIIHRRLYENMGTIFGNKKKLTIKNKLTPNERIYYEKYIKYKTKYLKLKNKLF